MLEVRRLRLLRELAIHQTMAATAEALHLTGPGISQQLAALEKEAGVPLLQKQGRGVEFTAAGRLLVEHTEVILGAIAAAEADLDAVRMHGRGMVRIAAFPSAARTLLPRLWRALTEAQAPPTSSGACSGSLVDLKISEQEPDAAIDLLRRREADLALVHAYSLLPRDLPTGCEQHHLMDDPVLLALPDQLAADRGLVAGQEVDLAGFADQNWLMPAPETSCHELIQRACGAAGFVPRPTMLATDFSVVTAMVGVGAGVGLVPQLALPTDLEGVSLHPLTRPVTRTIFAITASGEARQPHLHRVLDGLQSAAAAQRMALSI